MIVTWMPSWQSSVRFWWRHKPQVELCQCKHHDIWKLCFFSIIPAILISNVIPTNIILHFIPKSAECNQFINKIMIGWQNPPPQIDKVGLFVAEQVNESFASEKNIFRFSCNPTFQCGISFKWRTLRTLFLHLSLPEGWERYFDGSPDQELLFT